MSRAESACSDVCDLVASCPDLELSDEALDGYDCAAGCVDQIESLEAIGCDGAYIGLMECYGSQTCDPPDGACSDELAGATVCFLGGGDG